MRAVLDASWRARLQAAVEAPPLRPRRPLWWRESRIGSAEPELVERADLGAWLSDYEQGGWRVPGELSDSLAQIAAALQRAGLAHGWRDEALAVRDEHGTLLGEVERGVARALGIATHAVHLAGRDERGRHWVQQRAFDKATDPGRWDTLMGGTVPASDDRDLALQRETWEEAGLHLADLRELRHGGAVRTGRPSREAPHGYIVEVIDWYTCTVPAGLQPANQDGEVACFALLEEPELARRLLQGEFTLDASMVFAQLLSAPE